MHYLWLVKADKRKPLEYGIVLAVLLLYRVAVWVSQIRKRSAAPSVPGKPAEITNKA